MARLNRAAVIAGAWAFIEAHGLDALTMRKLASSLGVNHGTLYWHVQDKHALIDALADDLLAGVADDRGTGTVGRERLAELAYRLRNALLAHRDGARVLAGTFVRQPNTLTFGEATVTAALEAGAAHHDAALLAFSVQYYVMGFVIEEQAERDSRPREDVDAERFPALAHGLDAMRNAPPDERFQYGLQLILRPRGDEV
ncbi:TetR/AcrR family transcriptional regulator C-terminal domain-containing protein [Mycolicibacterium mageritense]|uniref:Tetracycline repressor protein class A from transposon 1721 n=1 Tax=Mycolicibacterium mageritense TaxID=53462 RepID=A0AAI8TR89_MYCME|nr:TetR/AcrR family transcriptional regulator C-terminal domain-containing protein [Mycolicibacterium mageritense]MBN3455177.1 TetR/AcrR family transcriptional regulator C-terminal domain-containing protein [Mycobacterium sp. DSM 3803]TXI61879.1 MAG: TetR family transcriptional regulator [Mycolicibacterium mageritense]BDY27065.1 Tetracycline repressor protein class A from transposon 1721 [Mycolicibacterium mageritense]GJJ17811.1 putative transcriptional regulator, TetR family protein [Mycolicib